MRPGTNRGPKVVRAPDFREEDFREVPVQLLAQWVEREVISPLLQREGNRFHAKVLSAHEANISAMPLVKVRVDTSVRADYSLRGGTSARSQGIVMQALQAVGGPQSGTASLLYHVIGLEWPIRRWCRAVGMEQGGNDARFASGMLVAALEVLSCTRWSS